MKKTFLCVLLCLTLAFSCGAAYASDRYTYFDIISTNYPEESIISDNVAYVNGVYYMSQDGGEIFYSHDARSWHAIDGSYGARIVSDKKRQSDFLAVFYNGNLAKSYDGANFELIRKFDANTVIKYENGIYTAYEKATDDGATLYFSYDCEYWFALPEIKAQNGFFTVDRYSDRYIVNGISTQSGDVSAIILSPGEVYILPYSHLTLDKANGRYEAVQKDGDSCLLWESDLSGAEFYEVKPPVDTVVSDAAYCGGKFYVITDDGDVYGQGGDWEDEWTGTNKMYVPVTRILDDDGAMREIYAWHNVQRESVGVYVVVTDKNGNSQSSSVELSGDLKMNMYGSVLCAANASGATNLLSCDGIDWHQTNDAEAFSILNEYTCRGKYMFVDRTENHTVFMPNGENPYANIKDKGIEVRIDGHYIAFDQAPTIVNDRTMVPLRAIAEALGANVAYDASTKNITMTKGADVIEMTVGADRARITYFDGAIYEPILDSPSVLINDRTLVPVRFISEAFNMNVEWASNTRTVWIMSK